MLNALLMGRDEHYKTPEKPGFILISTQNPISMAGRRATSFALERRMMHEPLSEYTDKELQSILSASGFSSKEAQSIVKIYHRCQNEANTSSEHLTFRDIVQKVIKPYQRIEEEKPVTRLKERLMKERTPAPSTPSTNTSPRL